MPHWVISFRNIKYKIFLNSDDKKPSFKRWQNASGISDQSEREHLIKGNT